MHDPEPLVLRAAAHPDRTVHRFGFDLDHRYLEQCWTPIIGPASTILLRRIPTLWRHAEPAHTSTEQLAGEIGLAPTTLRRVLRRVHQFGFATPVDDAGVIDIYSTVAPLAERHLDRVPASTRQTHHELLSEHLHAHAAAVHQPHAIGQRLDRLQHQSAAPGITR
jgi:hypothetical protein